jgi:16S rRNA (guanine527-N7)-methyltransferase
LGEDDASLADLVSRGAAELALPLASSDVHRLVAYVRLVERWNTTYNLTAIRDPRNMVVQHILDCLAAAAALGRRRGAGRVENLVDVGSGAGLPGVVIAIAFRDREITCVDSVARRPHSSPRRRARSVSGTSRRFTRASRTSPPVST